MDQKVIDTARDLQTALARVDTDDEDTLLWAHGFLYGLMDAIESKVPRLKNHG